MVGPRRRVHGSVRGSFAVVMSDHIWELVVNIGKCLRVVGHIGYKKPFACLFCVVGLLDVSKEDW